MFLLWEFPGSLYGFINLEKSEKMLVFSFFSQCCTPFSVGKWLKGSSSSRRNTTKTAIESRSTFQRQFASTRTCRISQTAVETTFAEAASELAHSSSSLYIISILFLPHSLPHAIHASLSLSLLYGSLKLFMLHMIVNMLRSKKRGALFNVPCNWCIVGDGHTPPLGV